MAHKIATTHQQPPATPAKLRTDPNPQIDKPCSPSHLTKQSHTPHKAHHTQQPCTQPHSPQDPHNSPTAPGDTFIAWHSLQPSWLDELIDSVMNDSIEMKSQSFML